MRHHTLSLCLTDRHRIAEIADRLRRLPCTNSVVTMDLHRIARELEALVEQSTPPAEPAAAQGRKAVAVADDP